MKTELFENEGAGKRRTWVWAVPFLVPIFFICGQVTSILPVKALGLISREQVEVYPYFLYFLVASFACTLGFLLLWVRYFEGREFKCIGLTFKRTMLPRFGVGFAAGLALSCLSVLGIWALGGYRVETPFDFGMASYGPIFLLMLAFGLQSTVEEIFFRGWMLDRVAARFGLWPGILANSMLFTLMHLDSENMTLMEGVTFAVMTTAFSIFLSLLVIRQKTVWGAGAWHAGWNWLFITWFGLPTTGIALDITPLWVDLEIAAGSPDWLTGGATGPENSLVTMAVLIVASLCLGLHLRRRGEV